MSFSDPLYWLVHPFPAALSIGWGGFRALPTSGEWSARLSLPGSGRLYPEKYGNTSPSRRRRWLYGAIYTPGQSKLGGWRLLAKSTLFCYFFLFNSLKSHRISLMDIPSIYCHVFLKPSLKTLLLENTTQKCKIIHIYLNFLLIFMVYIKGKDFFFCRCKIYTDRTYLMT